MSDSWVHDWRAALIITNLVKFYVAVDLSGEACPLCRRARAHDDECPLSLAWSLLSEEQQDEARRSLRALALSIAVVDESNGLTH